MSGTARLGRDTTETRVLRSLPLPEDTPVGPVPLEGRTGPLPGVTIALPVLNEAAYIDGCLRAVVAQTYPRIVEILVVDGGSDDATRDIAARFPGVRVVENPGRRQSAGLNVALYEARGDVLVRVDGRTVEGSSTAARLTCPAALKPAVLHLNPPFKCSSGAKPFGAALPVNLT